MRQILRSSVAVELTARFIVREGQRFSKNVAKFVAHVFLKACQPAKL